MSIFAMSFFGYVGVGFLVLLGVFALVWAVNRRAGKDLFAAGRAQVGKLGTSARLADPKAMLEQEIKDAQDELKNSVPDLEESKGLVTELNAQVTANHREASLIDNKIKSSLLDDPEDKNGKAGEYAVKLANVKSNLETNQHQLKSAQTMYANNLAKFRLAMSKVARAEERARQLGLELKNSETNAKIAKVAAKFNVSTGGLDGAVEEAEAAVRGQIARNNAVSEVQTDLGFDGVKEAEEEDRLRKAEAKLALEQYRKDMGLTPTTTVQNQ